jgi:hypothetical protein
LNKFLIKARLYGGFAPDSNKLVSVLLTFEKLKEPFMNKSCTGVSTATGTTPVQKSSNCGSTDFIINYV